MLTYPRFFLGAAIFAALLMLSTRTHAQSPAISYGRDYYGFIGPNYAWPVPYIQRTPHLYRAHGFHRSGSRYSCAGGVWGPAFEIYAPGGGSINDFGPFTGARHDEANLLHLGGGGPYTGTPDIIDMIEGRRGLIHP